MSRWSAPLASDLRWVRPPDEALLRPSGSVELGTARERSDPNDLDARPLPAPSIPDPELESRVDQDLAEDGASPRAQKLPAPRPPGPLQATREHERAPRGDLRQRPPDGMKSSDAAKLDDRIKEGRKALAEGPKAKAGAPATGANTQKSTSAQKPSAKPTPPPATPPAPKPAAKESSTSQGGGESDPVAAWQGRQVGKAQAIEAPAVSDGQRYVVTFQEAGSSARAMSPGKKLELLKDAEKKVPALEVPDDAPKIPNPDEIPEARQVVDTKTKLKLPPQTLPDLEPTPLGNMPEVGMSLQMGADQKLHVMKEVTGADGKSKQLEIKVVPEDAKPSKDQDVIEVKGFKKGSIKSVDELVAEGKKKGQTQKAASGAKSKGLKIEGDLIPGRPVVPEFAKVDIASVLAKVLAAPGKHATHIVEDARTAFAKGSMQTGEVAQFVDGELASVGAELLKVKAAAGVTDEALDAKAKAEKEKLEKEAGKNQDKVMDQYAEATGAHREERTGLGDFIQNQKADMDRKADDAKALSEGGFEPEQVKQQRDALKRESAARVVHWRGIFQKRGEGTRETPARCRRWTAPGLHGGGGDRSATDRSRARRHLGFCAQHRGQGVPPHRKVDLSAPTRARSPSRGDGERRHVARDRVHGGIAEAGEQADTLIDAWADKRLGIEKSWWDKLVEFFTSYFFETKKKARVWETENFEDNNANLNRDMIWLAQLQITHGKELNAELLKDGHGFTEEQKAMIKAVVGGGDSATALAAGLVARLSRPTPPGATSRSSKTP